MSGRKQSKTDLSEQKMLFCKYYAEGNSAVQAALKAGYAEKTANINVYRWLDDDKIKKTITHFKEIAQKHLEKKFCYTVEESFKKLQEIQELALLTDENGKYYNLSVASKVEELKGKLAQLYVEKQEISSQNLNITFNRDYD